MPKNICVFCSSSDFIDRVYFEETEKLSRLLVKTGCSLVFGGGMIGLMGEAARIFKDNGREVIGVIPKKLNKKGIVFEESTRIIETVTMNERKLIMQEMSEAFICLPGGFGTLEEMLEVITSKQLGFHNKPVAVLNTCGFYDRLFGQFDVLFNGKFTDAKYKNLYYSTDDPEALIDYLENYRPVDHGDKLPSMHDQSLN